MDAFCYTHPGRAPCIVMVDFVSLTTIVPSLLSSYYKSVSGVARPLAPPATRSTWRMPADKALLEARGAFATYWDPVLDRPRESPTKARGGSGNSAPNSPRPPASPRRQQQQLPGAPQMPPPLGLSSLAPQQAPPPAAAAAIASAGAAAGWPAGAPPPPPPPPAAGEALGAGGAAAGAAPPPLPATRVA